MKTDITIILDRSGSMASIKDDTIGGFNSFIDEQKRVEGGDEVVVSLIQFDTKYEVNYLGVPIGKVEPLTNATFVPRGWTALYDAMGRGIVEASERVGKDDKVMIIVITDGRENRSQEFDQATIKKLVERHMDEKAWQFVFLGANQDAVLEASRIGVPRGSTMSYAASPIGTQSAYDSLSRSVATSRLQNEAVAFSDEDRASALGETCDRAAPSDCRLRFNVDVDSNGICIVRRTNFTDVKQRNN